jgi:hypothetical protein
MDASLTGSDLGRLFSNSQGLVAQLLGSDRCLILQKEMQIAVLRIRDVSRIPDPDFYPSRIPDLGSKNSNKRER